MKETYEKATFRFLLLASALNAVTIMNNTSAHVNLVDFHFISGKEIYLKPFSLALGKKYIDDDIASFNFYSSAHKTN